MHFVGIFGQVHLGEFHSFRTWSTFPFVSKSIEDDRRYSILLGPFFRLSCLFFKFTFHMSRSLSYCVEQPSAPFHILISVLSLSYSLPFFFLYFLYFFTFILAELLIFFLSFPSLVPRIPSPLMIDLKPQHLSDDIDLPLLDHTNRYFWPPMYDFLSHHAIPGGCLNIVKKCCCNPRWFPCAL